MALAQRVIRHTRVSDLASCEVNDAIDITRAINSALEEWFSLAPHSYRRTTASHTFTAPRVVSISVTGDDTSVSGNPFTTLERGCSIIIDGDDVRNEIVDTNALLHTYSGTTGTVSATIYHDCVAMTNFRIERLTAAPYCLETKRELKPRPQMDTDWIRNGSVGDPQYFNVEYIGNAEQVSNDGVFQVRVSPMPGQSYRIKMPMEFRPISYGIDCLSPAGNAEIPVPDALAFSTLMPMVEAELIASPCWRLSTPPTTTGRISDAADRARDMVTSLQSNFLPQVTPATRIHHT